MNVFTPAFLDELRGRADLAALVGRSVKLVRSGREQKGCCPFHAEKTPSFYVYADHFHCFGCGAHGDAVDWLMKSHGESFTEAVQALAREVGLAVPEATPEAAAEERRRRSLLDVLQAVARLYHDWLFEKAGAPALVYLHGRGLTDATITAFHLGWSGEGRGALAATLRAGGITVDDLVAAGLMKRTETGAAVDMFFGRVMFPIRDRAGAVIGFSGRVLGEAQPKYVNGPETACFLKRRSLYGLDQARAAARQNAELVVAEGQMDVLALAQAGFAAVAPLGTALTEEQLQELWRITPAPVICFDGDAAGQRAMLRAAELALPSVSPERTLKFARLAGQDDPDNLVSSGGADGFAAVLAAARPLHLALYDMLAEATAAATPEGRAALHRRLLHAASRLSDPVLQGEYRAALLRRFFEAPALPPEDGEKSDMSAVAFLEWLRAQADASPLQAVSFADAEMLVPARVQLRADQRGPLFEPHPRPQNASTKSWAWVVAARDGAAIVDLVAVPWDCRKVLGRWRGVANVLGTPQHPETAATPVRLFRDVAGWLAARCAGVVLVGTAEENLEWLRRCAAGIVTDDLAHGKAVKKMLARPYAGPDVLVAG